MLRCHVTMAAMDVMVVDDSRVARVMLQRVLHEALPGARVIEVNDLESALEWSCRSKAPGLVLLDLGLPGCEGLDALARFRSNSPLVPVAVISAAEDRESIDGALEGGAVGYISKGSSRDEIVTAVRQVVAGSTYTPPEFASAH